MDLIVREKDTIGGHADLEALYEFQNFPVFMGTTHEKLENDVLADMNWFISKSTGMIQLDPLLPMTVLYPESHGSGCVGRLWLEHHQAFAEFLKKYSPRVVLEIGGAHGILSRNYQALDANCDWTIIEPNPIPEEGVKANFIKGFFDENFDFEQEVDAIVHSHVFEHVYDPQVFMKNIAAFLPEGKHLVFTLPNMEVMLDRKYTNCINFEHTIFLTEPYIELLLSQHGFRVLEKEYFRDDHSIFYGCVRENEVPLKTLPEGLYHKNKQLYEDYVEYHEQLIAELNEKIEKLNGESLYLFGAHVFAQYLIGFGLQTDKIVCLLDNDPNKQGKRLYGTSLQVASPKILKDVEQPVVILKAGVYNEEIKADILENINPQTMFWE